MFHGSPVPLPEMITLIKHLITLQDTGLPPQLNRILVWRIILFNLLEKCLKHLIDYQNSCQLIYLLMDLIVKLSI